ncbi:MAG: sugar ABC transporter permease [Hyphomonadaceae bacterium]|jgi:glycerol transport system permease protein|nr:sugar ABC transporter permease [Hyphomonadaceae bacterium]
MKPVNQKAWFLVAPVLLLVAFTAIIPLMTVVNYSVQYVATNAQFHWVGDLWYREVLHSEKFWNALWRNLVFSGIILAIQIPLGVLIALNMPRKGWGVPACLVLMSLPLLIPWYVVGMIWQMFGRVDIGLMGVMLRDFGYNYEGDPLDAWFTLIIMDVWHWTSLVALLAYAGLVSIPNAYYQAARIDGASGWQVFLHVQLPRMARVLTIAVLLRFMDSFMIFTEPFAVIAGGDPVFLSTELSQTVELGQRAAMSIIYFLIILLLSWVFYTVMTRDDGEPTQSGAKP